MSMKPRSSSHCAYWQRRVLKNVDHAIESGNASFGRALAGFLARQVMRLDAKYGPSLERTQSPTVLKRNRYKIAARVLESLGYPQRHIAEVLCISQAAVHRLLIR